MSIETGLLVMFVLLGTFGVWAAYRNGVEDGYNAGKYPDHPGYQKARKILDKTGQWREVVPDYWSDIEMHLLKHRGETPENPRKPNPTGQDRPTERTVANEAGK
jgi:hypothetical protein